MSNAVSYDDLDDLFAGGGSPAASFKAIGDSITGVITDAVARQQTDFDDGTPLTWDNGDPMMEVVLTLSTSLRDKEIEDDDGSRRVFCRGQMLTAMKQAVRKAKDKKPRIGGRITITHTDLGEVKKKGFNAPKLFEVVYEAPNDVALEALVDEPDETPAPAAPAVSDEALEKLKNMDPAELAALLASK